MVFKEEASDVGRPYYCKQISRHTNDPANTTNIHFIAYGGAFFHVLTLARKKGTPR